MLKTLGHIFKGGPKSIIHHAEVAYDLGWKQAQRQGLNEKLQHEAGVFKALGNFCGAYQTKLSQLPSFAQINSGNTFSMMPEALPFLLLPNSGKRAMGLYQAWLVYGAHPEIPMGELRALVNRGWDSVQEELDEEEQREFLRFEPVWMGLLDE